MNILLNTGIRLVTTVSISKKIKRKVAPKNLTRLIRNTHKKSELSAPNLLKVRLYKFPSLKRIIKISIFGTGLSSSLIKLK